MKKIMLCVALAMSAILSMPALADIDYSPPGGGFDYVVDYQAPAPAVDSAPVLLTAAVLNALDAMPSVMVAGSYPAGPGGSWRTKVTDSLKPNNDGVIGSGDPLEMASAVFEVGWGSISIQ